MFEIKCFKNKIESIIFKLVESSDDKEKITFLSRILKSIDKEKEKIYGQKRYDFFYVYCLVYETRSF